MLQLEPGNKNFGILNIVLLSLNYNVSHIVHIQFDNKSYLAMLLCSSRKIASTKKIFFSSE